MLLCTCVHCFNARSHVSPDGECAGNDEETMVPDETAGLEELALRPRATFNIVSITEGIKNYPFQRQLTNPIPFDSDFTIIVAVGFTGDKLDIKLTDQGGLGDRLMGIALAFYNNLVLPSGGVSTALHREIHSPLPFPCTSRVLSSGFTPAISGNRWEKIRINIPSSCRFPSRVGLFLDYRLGKTLKRVTESCTCHPAT